jgi:hypothetical protein
MGIVISKTTGSASDPSSSPTGLPSIKPISYPTSRPSSRPTDLPTSKPSNIPSAQPSSHPRALPTSVPTVLPSSQPSTQPSAFPTSQPTSHPTVEPSRQPSSLPTAQPSRQPSSRPSAQPTRQPTSQPTTQPSSQPSSRPSRRPSAQPTRQPSRQPTSQPTMAPTGQPTNQPTRGPTSQPTAVPSSRPTSFPTRQPTETPSTQPTRQPTRQPTGQPTKRPTSQPSSNPTGQPTVIPTGQPTTRPTSQPSLTPSSQPTSQPTRQPTGRPTNQPTYPPSAQPTTQPTAQPTVMPTAQPSSDPSGQPSRQPTRQPTSQPTRQPTRQPTSQPTRRPSSQPTAQPSRQPTFQPSRQPTTQPTAQPTQQPTAQPTRKPSNQPTVQPTRNPSRQPTSQPTRQPTSQPTRQPTRSPTGQPSRQPSVQPTTQPSKQPTDQPTRQPTSQPTSQPTRQPTRQPTAQPTRIPTCQPSGQPTVSPTDQPSSLPSAQPTSLPSGQPSAQPSSCPSSQPTAVPSGQPSSQPSMRPSTQPSSAPSSQPTARPSGQPSFAPTGQPTAQPSSRPSRQPSSQPTRQPTSQPSRQPTRQPTSQPTRQPTRQPTAQPSRKPTGQPSSRPSRQPTRQPTTRPSQQPTAQPTVRPTSQPTSYPSGQPSSVPSGDPTGQPTCQPTSQPSRQPTRQPTTQPTRQPTSQPTRQPTSRPTAQPSRQPSRQPTGQPTYQPSTQPTNQPTGDPSGIPSAQPSAQPTRQPTRQPTGQPTRQPSRQPTAQPTVQPTGQPTGDPSTQPSVQPSTQPSRQPSKQPTSQPSRQPTAQPSRQPSIQPTSQPSEQPTSQPSWQPSRQPTSKPTAQPSSQPSRQPTRQPTSQPTSQPSNPSGQPTMQPTIQPTTQPSGQPSRQPSGQPSTQPTTQPSRQPTAQPTRQPTRQPSSQPTTQPSSRPTTNCPTSIPSKVRAVPLPPNFKSSAPTYTPTYDSNYRTAPNYPIYQSQKLAFDANSSSSTSSSRIVTFSSFYYKGMIIPGGQCNDWISFVKSSIQVPKVSMELQSIRLEMGYYDYDNGMTVLRNATCSTLEIVERLYQNLVLGTNYERICNGNSWRVFRCSNNQYPVMCINCKLNCVPTVSCPGTYPVVNPCGSCSTDVSSFAFVEFGYAVLASYPQLAVPMNVTVLTSNEIEVIANYSSAGTVYCSAIPDSHSIVSNWQVMQGATRIILPVDAEAGFFLASTRFRNLSPSTAYNVLCVSQGFSSNQMPFSEVWRNRGAVTMSCCRRVQLLQASPILPVYSSISGRPEPLFIVGLDSEPAGTSSINITVSTVYYDCKNASKRGLTIGSAYASPSSFIFSSTGALTGSFVVRGNAVGCVMLLAAMNSVNISTNGAYYQSVSYFVSVVSIPTPPTPPLLVSAVLSSDARLVTISFDSQTDRGLQSTSVLGTKFSCSKLFAVYPRNISALSRTSASGFSCAWINSNQLNLFAISMPSVFLGPGSQLRLQESSIRAAWVPKTDFSAYSFTKSSTINITAPSALPPVISLSFPPTVGFCDNIVIDPSATAGNIGAKWSKVQWYVTGRNEPPLNLTLAPVLALMNGPVYAGSTQKLITIPRKMVSAGTYNFSLYVQNQFGLEDFKMISVAVVDRVEPPQICVTGPQNSIQYSWQPTVLTSSLAVASCYVPFFEVLSVTWNVYRNGIDYVPTLVSSSSDVQTFRLPSYSLLPLSSYVVEVVVARGRSVNASSRLSSATFAITTGHVPVTAFILGGAIQMASVDQLLRLDASQSYDGDNNSATLVYSWSCIEDAPNYGALCSGKEQTYFHNANRDTLILPANAMSVKNYSITVTVTNRFSGSYGTYGVLIVYKLDPLPRQIVRNLTKYNVNSGIILNASIDAQYSTQAHWVCEQLSATQLAEISLTSTMVILNPGSTFISLYVRPYTLIAGQQYTFYLNSFYINVSKATVQSSVTVVMNTPPTNGVFYISPSTGVSMNTSFFLATANWQDDISDYPLLYLFGSYAVTARLLTVVKPWSQSLTAHAFLEAGLAESRRAVTCIAASMDFFGASANISTIATVNAVPASTNLTQAINSEVAYALATGNYNGASQLLSAASIATRQISCVTPFPCSSLNREGCLSSSKTCGQCLPGYVGEFGDANSNCFLVTSIGQARRSLTSSLTNACGSNSSCLSNFCEKGQCTVPLKECPNSCSSFGTCVYRDYFGTGLTSCNSLDPYCTAVCECLPGRSGKDCLLDPPNYAEAFLSV